MKCPECDKQAPCKDSRDSSENTRRRVYRCPCGVSFTTLEMVVGVNRGSGALKGYRRGTKLPEVFRERQKDALRAEVSAELREQLNSLLQGNAKC